MNVAIREAYDEWWLGERRNGLGVRAIAGKLKMAPSSVHKILKSADVN